MPDERQLFNSKTEDAFVLIDGKELEVEIIDIGYDFLKARFIGKNENELSPAASSTGVIYIIPSENLKVRKKIGK